MDVLSQELKRLYSIYILESLFTLERPDREQWQVHVGRAQFVLSYTEHAHSLTHDMHISPKV